MSTNIFKENKNSIPMNDAKVVRIEFDKSDIGATKSHIKGLHSKNDYTIKHVGG